MRRLAVLLLFAAVLAGGPLLAQTPSANQRKLPPAFATAKREIEIPFSVTQGATPESQVTRVDVFISWDFGRNWFKYTEVPPDAGKFRFVAKKDMEFWFLTQTISGQEKQPRDEVKWPELRLIVDTQKPDLRMAALLSPAGQPDLTWSVTDATLDPASLKIEYQDGAGHDDNWHAVELSAKENVASASGIVGKKSLVLPSGMKAVNLRAEVSDIAGNKSVFSQHLALPGPQELAAAERRERPQQLADASARHWPSDAQTQDRADGLASTPESSEPLPSAEEMSSEPEPKLVQNPYAGKGKLAVLQSPAKNRPAESESALPPPAAADESAEEMPSISADAMPPPHDYGPEQEPLPEPEGAARREPLEPSRDLQVERAEQRPLPEVDDIGPIPSREALPSVAPTMRPDADSRPLPSGDSIPAGDCTRLANTRRFNLDYDVESVGPEGIAEVELWGTSDGGKTWIKWGTDPDRLSPMEVEVSREMVYGFRVVIVGKNGLVGNRPDSGDEADIWIEIDLTRPAARITAAAYGSGEHAGELDIRWDAQDKHLGPRPITLSFSNQPDGKFSTIAAGLPNSGQYFWRFDPRSPRQLYLRLEVRDDAGNISADQLAEPINVEGLTPKGRIRSLTPAAGSGIDSSGALRKPLFK